MPPWKDHIRQLQLRRSTSIIEWPRDWLLPLTRFHRPLLLATSSHRLPFLPPLIPLSFHTPLIRFARSLPALPLPTHIPSSSFVVPICRPLPSPPSFSPRPSRPLSLLPPPLAPTLHPSSPLLVHSPLFCPFTPSPSSLFPLPFPLYSPLYPPPSTALLFYPPFARSPSRSSSSVSLSVTILLCKPLCNTRQRTRGQHE